MYTIQYGYIISKKRNPLIEICFREMISCFKVYSIEIYTAVLHNRSHVIMWLLVFAIDYVIIGLRKR